MLPNLLCSESVYTSFTKTDRRIFVVFDSADSARAAVLIKGQAWRIASLVQSPKDIIADFKSEAVKGELFPHLPYELLAFDLEC